MNTKISSKDILILIGFLILMSAVWYIVATTNFNNIRTETKPHVGIDNINGIQKYDGTTITFNVYNDGTAKAENVRVGIEILDSSLNIIEYKEMYIGNINNGESHQFTAYMNSINVNNGKILIYPDPDRVHATQAHIHDLEIASGVRTRI